ncbi:MAG: M12 family metallopeptidase [Coleofasciculus sp. A1-SPW-01]|uniref:matrixin family metalloprotease n=1 Tax=Coleofasciculus sp. A1-SPW-01 TaxID=3070819 RepID=UPI0032F6DDB8
MVQSNTNPFNEQEQSAASISADEGGNYSYCSLPEVAPRDLSEIVDRNRANLIQFLDKKWVNGTILHYYFFDQPTEWATTETEKNVVRQAFNTWKQVGMGLEFKEVNLPDEAEIRIGFLRGDGAWSYIGRDILNIGRDERTMNFGWDLTRFPGEINTAIHEIGHTLGLPHEHQNPNAGIVWDEEAVYASLAAPPNNWDRETTYYNIIRKINPDMVQGSNWDPNSVMHYPFGAGLIKEPPQYQNGLTPEPGLSERDTTWVKQFYPLLEEEDYTELKPFQSVPLTIAPGEQMNFRIEPNATRSYMIRTFGTSDTVMVLFEEVDGELRYLTGDDDSGEDYNAEIKVRLFRGRRYVLRIRLYYSDRAGETAVMMW